jgi:hypothetical protein
LTDSGSINQEFGKLKTIRYRNFFCHNIIVEVLVKKFGSEFRVEWSTVRYESTGFGYITSKSLFERFELLSTCFPSNLIILKGVNKSISLVHLSSCLVCFLK